MQVLRIWLKYRRRENFEVCPKCGAPLRWKTDGCEWFPCDPEPVFFRQSDAGKCKVYKKGELLTGCEIPEKDLTDCERGLLPHFYSCGVYKN